MAFFKDYKFGYADAETELEREPNIFANTFYDPSDFVSNLINGFQFLVVGRKGSGKSAIAAKIKLLSEDNPEQIVNMIDLADFEYRTFTKISSYDFSGGARYATPWKLMLLLRIYSSLDQIDFVNTQEPFHKIAKRLKDYGLVSSDSLQRVIRIISRNGFRITLPYDINIDLGSHEKETEISSPEDIINAISPALQQVDYKQMKLYLIIDGLDDTLRGKVNQLEMVSGLISAVSSLNRSFLGKNIPIKFILMVRTDILAKCNDPDLNKIKRDSQLELTWYRDVQNPLNSDLMELVKLRFATADPELAKQKDAWYALFPSMIFGDDSWHYILEHTLLRPRDILQFLIECKRLYPNESSLIKSQVKAVLSNYSEKYFIDEMKNELSGFLSEEIIMEIPSLLTNIGNNVFTFAKWCSSIEKYEVFKKDDRQNILEKLFDSGYIGQLSNREGKTFVLFKHRDTHIRIDYSQQFIVHRGLHKGLNLD